MIKNFVFDVGEVLFSGIMPFHNRINELFSPPKPLVNADLYHSLYMQLYLCGNITEDQLWRAVIAGFKLQATPQQLAEAVRREFVAVEGTLDIVRELRSAGYRIGILSIHGREWIDYLEALHAFHAHFEPGCLCYSCHTRYMKPDPQSFVHVAECLQALPQDCMFIDDHRPNCDAAQKLGFTSHLFTSAENLRLELNRLGLLPARRTALPS